MQRSGNKSRTQALNQIHQLLVTAPEDLRAGVEVLLHVMVELAT